MRRKLHDHVERVRIYDASAATDCWICGETTETQEHLMFSCCYSRKLLKEVKRWMDIDSPLEYLHKLVRWVSNCRKSKFQKASYSAAIAGVVYGV